MLETVVAISLLVLLGALAGAGWASLEMENVTEQEAEIDRARRDAILRGTPREASVDSFGATALFLPDGRVIGEGYDLLTGRRIRP